jgi:hypothetical protein
VLPWLLAAAAGVLLAALHYFRERRTPTVGLAALLRVVAVLFAIALMLDAPRGRASMRAPMVALDASASWQRGRPDSAWRSVLDRARREAGGDTLWLLGDSLRPAGRDSVPLDAASRVEGIVNRALGAGRPLVLFSDGEIDDPELLERLLAGSRIDIAPPAPRRDVAILGIELPRSAVGGDTIEVVVRLSAGAAGSSAGAAALTLDRAQLETIPFDSLAPFAERDVRAKVRVPQEGGEHRTLRVAIAAPGDATPRNDSLAAALDVASAPRAVFVSTSPDQDSRFALEVLRGTLAIAVRAYYRVAPGVWTQEPGYSPTKEADVRTALAEAPIAIIHGDTALFGPPRGLTSGALALLAPAAGDGDEWYAVAAPTSPISPALAGLPWDSLPPLAIGAAPKGEWTALAAQRRRSARDERAVIAGSEQPRRVVVVTGSGYWRWRFRAGASTEAFAALWGGVFDWMAAGGDDRRGAVPAAAWARAGDQIVWRRGARRDSVVTVVLRNSGTARVDTVTLRFPGSATVAESPPLPAGEYDITVPGGRTRLAVSVSREWLPRRASVASGDKGTARPSGLAPRLRDAWWAYVLALAALCMEWLVRRRAGLR